jgi:hypothetical protein
MENLMKLMGRPATLSQLIVVKLLGGFSLLLVEIRFEHREALGQAWQSWIPLLYSGAMLLLGLAAMARWNSGGRRVLMAGFAAAVLVGLLGLWFHSEGHPVSRVLQVLGTWALHPGDGGGIKVGAAPVLAPLAFVGLGWLGVLACAWPYPAEQAAQPELSKEPWSAGLSTTRSPALGVRPQRSGEGGRSIKQ